MNDGRTAGSRARDPADQASRNRQRSPVPCWLRLPTTARPHPIEPFVEVAQSGAGRMGVETKPVIEHPHNEIVRHVHGDGDDDSGCPVVPNGLADALSHHGLRVLGGLSRHKAVDPPESRTDGETPEPSGRRSDVRQLAAQVHG